MKNLAKIAVPTAIAAMMSACQGSDTSADTIFACDSFTVYTDSVVQGPYTARAVSATEITTDYRSADAAASSPVARFRFSINSRDNELPSGNDHVALVTDADAPVYSFGSTEGNISDEQAVSGDTLPVNTPWTVRLDMRPVLRSFDRNGWFATATGDTIYADDFKGVWIAGSVEPLSWDFENLYSRDDRKLKDRGDSIYEVTLKVNPSVKRQPDPTGWKIDAPDKNFPLYTSDQTLVDALYNMAISDLVSDIRPDDTYRAGKEWDGVWTRDVSYAIYLSLAYLDPERSKNSLRAKVNRGRIVQDTGTGGAWPVSSDRIVWATAAWEIYLATGDREWLAESRDVISATLADDMLVTWDADLNLVHGEQSYLDWREQTYPRWMQPADIFGSMCLGTNVMASNAYAVLAWMNAELGVDDSASEAIARKIATAINDNLWIPNRGYYSEYLYCQPYPIASQATDNLGQALAIIFGVASPEMAQSVMKNTPRLLYGTSSVFPQLVDIKPYHNDAVWPFVQSFWNIAAARTGNATALSAGLGALYRAAALFATNKELFVAHNGDYRGTAVNSDAQLWSAAGSAAMIFRVYAGISLAADGMHFTPIVPDALTGVKKISGLKYRGSTVDIAINGTGSTMLSFKVDGRLSNDHVLPANIAKGHHTVEITLDNQPLKKSEITFTQQVWMPATPVVVWTDPRTAKITSGVGEEDYALYLNGIMEQELVRPEFNLYDAPKFTAVNFVPILDEDVWGFSPRPYYYFPASSEVHLNAPDFATPGTSFIKDSEKARRFVELTTTRNTRVEFRYTASAAGEYFVDVRYANGSGPINTENKCGLRTLSVNGEPAGAIVMPQRGIGEWLSTGFSNMLKVKLNEGENKLVIEYLEPQNVNMNVETNTALIEYMRVIKK